MRYVSRKRDAKTEDVRFHVYVRFLGFDYLERKLRGIEFSCSCIWTISKLIDSRCYFIDNFLQRNRRASYPPRVCDAALQEETGDAADDNESGSVTHAKRIGSEPRCGQSNFSGSVSTNHRRVFVLRDCTVSHLFCFDLNGFEQPFHHLTRIRRQFVVYFCRHRGKLAGKDGGASTRILWQPTL